LHKVKRYLAIAANESVNRPFSSHPLSQFSPQAFAQAAQGQDLPTFARSLVPEIEAGLVRPFVTEVVVSKLFGAPRTLGDPLLDNLYGGGLTLTLASKAVGWVGSLFGLGTGTKEQLQDIQNQLNQVQSQLTALSAQIAQTQLNLDIRAAVNAIGSYTAVQNSTLSADLASYTPFSADNTFLGNVDGQSWANPSSITNATNSAYSILGVGLDTGSTAGQGNLLTYQVQQTAVNVSGSGPYSSYNGTVWSSFYDFRNDLTATPQVANVTNWYGLEVALAGNWLSESATQALGANNVSAVPSLKRVAQNLNGYGVNQTVGAGLPSNVNSLGNGMAALTQRITQQGPMAMLGGQNALGSVCGGVNDPESQSGTGPLNGSLWTHYATVTSFPQGDPTGFSGPSPLDCRNFNTNGWYDWYVPTQDEVKQLFARANRIAQAQGHTGSDAVPFGLAQMGLMSASDLLYAQQNGNKVYVYSDWSLDGETPHLYTTGSDGSHNNNGLDTILAEGQTLIDPGVQLRVVFKPLKTGLALLVRPLPGAPKGSTTEASIPPSFANAPNTGPASPGQASQSGAPIAVQNSATAQKLGSGAWFWNTDLALACSFIPDEVVVQPDSTQPQQLRAYAIWTVNLKGAPSSYRSNAFEKEGSNYSGVIGNFGYPQTPFASSYLIYNEITEVAEWLSSNTNAVEVSNFKAPTVALQGGSISGVSGAATILNATLNGNSLSGGRLTASLAGGSVSGGTTFFGPPFAGNVALGPSNATISGANVLGGTLSPTSTNTLINPADGSTVGTIVNGTVSGATLTGGLLTVPAGGGSAGWLNPHSAGQPVTISASLMYSPTTDATINEAASAAAFRAGTYAYTASSANTSLATVLLSPNYNKVLNANNVVFYLTGIHFDGLYEDLTSTALSQITWRVYLLTDGTSRTAPGLAFQTGDSGAANILNIPTGFAGYVAVQATYAGESAWSFLNLINSGGSTPLPSVTAMLPATGPVAGGTTITVFGSNFTGVTGVTVGGQAAAFTFVASGQLTVVTPAGTAPGPASVVVTTPGGSSSPATFTYQ
jgi:hypothetical protein